MFSITNHKGKTFKVELKDAKGNVLETFELAGIGYHYWHELGLMVTTEQAPKIKDKNSPDKYVEDITAQKALDEQANILRNAVRVVYALESGGGIDWGDKEPPDLLSKAKALQEIDADIFTALLNALQLWLFGKKVSTADEINRFQ